MADPLKQLAPLIEPTAPIVAAQAATPQTGTPVEVFVVIAVVLLTVAAVALLLWHRSAWARGLRRVEQRVVQPGPSSEAAHALAALARRHKVDAPDAWWQALDRLRFARPQFDHTDILARLAIEARHFPRRGGSR
ncbi:MAG: hypothetical protein Q7U13_02315 [Rhodoferax sp.]|nr:hypothetical protein [Rhodoferax sp.]